MKKLFLKGVQMVALVVVTAGMLAACSSDEGGEAGGGGGGDGPITAVKGSACGYFVNVGLFGGPQQLRGCGQKPNDPPTGTSPFVSLPEPGGSATPITASDADGAVAQYGPARIFAGLWPCDPGNCPAVAPPSGPMSVSTQGTPESGTVTSSADIVLAPQETPVACYQEPANTANCRVRGGFGPAPVEGDELHVSCTANAEGITGTTRFVKGLLATATDAEGEPTASEPIPDNPPVNYTRSGEISNVGDVFTVVFNEQIHNPDGSLTVNAIHMYLFGPVAVGEMVKGQATCGLTPSPLDTKDPVAPTCGNLVVEHLSPEDPTPKSPRTELIGVFDARGLKSIDNIKVTNGNVQVGKPGGEQYLQLKPGQTGPLPVTAIRSPEAESANQPMTWSFEATDMAGNKTQCPGK